MLKKISIVLALCLSMTNLYADKTADGGPCNPNGLTSTDKDSKIKDEDKSCSGYCDLGDKKCASPRDAGTSCNRDAQCKNKCKDSVCT